MILKNFQACCLQFQLYMMMRKMYCMMLSNYLQLFRLKYIIEQIIVKYIIEQIYVHKKINTNLLKTNFQKNVDKTCYKMYFYIHWQIFQTSGQVDGCTMGGPIFVSFSLCGQTIL